MGNLSLGQRVGLLKSEMNRRAQKKAADVRTLVASISSVTVNKMNGQKNSTFGLSQKGVAHIAQGNVSLGVQNTKGQPSRKIRIKNNAQLRTTGNKIAAKDEPQGFNNTR